MMEANDIFAGMDDVKDPILIHGIIDGYFKREDGYVLFDYKTDKLAHLGDKAEDELLNRYKGQVLLYKEARLLFTFFKSVNQSYKYEHILV